MEPNACHVIAEGKEGGGWAVVSNYDEEKNIVIRKEIGKWFMVVGPEHFQSRLKSSTLSLTGKPNTWSIMSTTMNTFRAQFDALQRPSHDVCANPDPGLVPGWFGAIYGYRKNGFSASKVRVVRISDVKFRSQTFQNSLAHTVQELEVLWGHMKTETQTDLTDRQPMPMKRKHSISRGEISTVAEKAARLAVESVRETLTTEIRKIHEGTTNDEQVVGLLQQVASKEKELATLRAEFECLTNSLAGKAAEPEPANTSMQVEEESGESLRKSRDLLRKLVRHSIGAEVAPGLANDASVRQWLRKKLTHVRMGLLAGIWPEKSDEGSGGVYMLPDENGEHIAIFKPRCEEPKMGNIGGIKPNEGFLREVAVASLDSIVPRTGFAVVQHPAFDHPTCSIQPTKKDVSWKTGSLQEFVHAQGLVKSLDSWGVAALDIRSVQRVAALDIRTVQRDRNDGNLFFTSDLQLVPIDHARAFGDGLNIMMCEVVWMSYPQVKLPIHHEVLSYIQAIDPQDDEKKLAAIGIGSDSARIMVFTVTLMQKLSAANWTLHQIGSVLYRSDDNVPSPAEDMLRRIGSDQTTWSANLKQELDQFCYHSTL